jgi:hypothetical protein
MKTLTITKPLGKSWKKHVDKDNRLVVEIDIDLNDLIDIGGIEGLNGWMEDHILGVGVGGVLCDISYQVCGLILPEPITHIGGSVVLRVNAIVEVY